MSDLVTFSWSTGIALVTAFAFLALALISFARRGARRSLSFPGALLATGVWLGFLAFTGEGHSTTLIAEAARNLAWLGFMAGLAGSREEGNRVTPIGAIYIGLGAIEALKIVILANMGLGSAAYSMLDRTLDTLAMLFAAGALVLLHNLAEAGRSDERRSLAIPLGALAGLWAYDLNLYAISYLSAEPAQLLLDVRPVAALIVAVALAIAALRPAGHGVSVSRPVVFRSLAIAAIFGWLALLALFSGLMRSAGLDFSGQAQGGVLAASVTAMALMFLSPRLRALARVWTVKHFFEHRYDYRAEWLRFTATLHRPEDGVLSLQARVIKAFADMVASDGGVLVACDRSGHLGVAAEWPGGLLVSMRDNDWARFGAWLEQSERIVQLDESRGAGASADERAAIPPALLADDRCWIAVPLSHAGALEGIVLLARPLVTRALDWEDFDLLKVASRQAASHLAEARRSDALAESGRFEEFHRRFAFMMHDVKNLASQMGVLARNAERHGDNPDFRVDMVETLKLSAERLAQLMQRLSQQEKARVTALDDVDLVATVTRVARDKGAVHEIELTGDPREVRARGDAETIEQLLLHLVQNAIDATPGDAPVVIAIEERAGLAGPVATVTVTDSGTGMSADFVRNQLFRPFSSTKEGGFGIGAYQARQLAEAMGGRLDVVSDEGVGTIFTLSLPVPVQDIGQRSNPERTSEAA